jgi:hypothetical protein
MRRLPEGSPIPRHTRGPFVSGSPISSGDKGPIAILRVKHFSPRHKIFGGPVDPDGPGPGESSRLHGIPMGINFVVLPEGAALMVGGDRFR